MDRQGELRIIRAAYAKQILAAARVVDNMRLEAALSATRREDFLGAGPWWIVRWFGDYVTTPDADPVYLYTNDLVGIVPERRINNGQPSLHAHLIHQASPAVGEHVVHIGTGTGYYTAILAHLVGPSGRVTGIEYEPELAARAKTNFATYPNVDIVEGRRRAGFVRYGRCHLRQCRLHAAGRKLARPPRRWRAPDPADDVGPRLCCKLAGANGECRCRLSNRASRRGLFSILDFAGCDLSVRRKPGRGL
jgi:protein-L-isoaspartate O-methyltransferase